MSDNLDYWRHILKLSRSIGTSSTKSVPGAHTERVVAYKTRRLLSATGRTREDSETNRDSIGSTAE
jgi:hypothetical protein